MKRYYYIIAMAMAAIFSLSASANNSSNVISNVKKEVVASQRQKDKCVSIAIYNYNSLSGSSIVNAAKRIRGVKSASWKRNSRLLVVVYNEKLVSLSQIRSALAKQGYQLNKDNRGDKNVGSKNNGSKNGGKNNDQMNNGGKNNGGKNNGYNNQGSKNSGHVGNSWNNNNNKGSGQNSNGKGGSGKQGGRK